jgi:Immunity protein 53
MEGLEIALVDNSSWQMKVSFMHSDYEHLDVEPIKILRSKDDWVEAKKEYWEFEASCGLKNLAELIQIFLNFLEELNAKCVDLIEPPEEEIEPPEEEISIQKNDKNCNKSLQNLRWLENFAVDVASKTPNHVIELKIEASQHPSWGMVFKPMEIFADMFTFEESLTQISKYNYFKSFRHESAFELWGGPLNLSDMLNFFVLSCRNRAAFEPT